MRKLLIVDDEKNIRVGLKAMIKREFGDAYSFCFAADGEEALKLFDEFGPHIIITDIRMPVMDGITLLEKLHERAWQPEVIILTGHDDFQFAKAAIRFHVKEYLLKPIVREELFRTLRRIDSELAHKDEMASQLRGTYELKKDYAIIQLNNLFLRESLEPGEIRKLLNNTELDWLDGAYSIGLLQLPCSYKGYSRSDIMSRIDGVMNWEPGERFIRFYDKDARLVLICGSDEPFERLSVYMRKQPAQLFRAGLSGRLERLEALKDGYSEAARALNYCLLQTSPGVVRSSELSSKETTYKLPIDDVQKIANLLGLDREAEMKRLLQHVLDIRRIMRYDIGYLEGICGALNEYIFDKVFRVYGEESIEILRLHKAVGNIYNFNQFHDYFHSVENLLLLLNDYVKRMKTVHNDGNEMQRAVRYIQDHYQEELNMAIVSNYVSLNYSYFSQAFKDYTGETFVSYLRRLRICKAKELLAETNMKVYEISGKAGFESVKHFTRVFKEMEGISPLEYRSRSEALGEHLETEADYRANKKGS